MIDHDTIVASATAPGRGAISVIRLSGPLALSIAERLSGKTLTPRHATLGACALDEKLDSGIWIYFPGPHSFTGENVCEFHGHGGPVVIQTVIQTMVSLGARHAKPGEFSERAFLNDKIDLAQAEAIADLISASSVAAVKAANRSLSGGFSAAVHHLVEQLIALRVQIEAHIDFPDEDISPVALHQFHTQLSQLKSDTAAFLSDTEQGSKLNQAFDVVLIGAPNAGKSSLLNALAQEPLAIVTDIPGTTRDLIRHHVIVQGIELRITDTAGIRKTTDAIEHEGIARAFQAIDQADLVVCLFDTHSGTVDYAMLSTLFNPESLQCPILLVQNKVDVTKRAVNQTPYPFIQISAKTGEGLPELMSQVSELLSTQTRDDLYLTRNRHIQKITEAHTLIENALLHPLDVRYIELIAEDLRLAQNALSEITGVFSSDDLLGEIFSTFCIGK